jgi:hypothetical protein
MVDNLGVRATGYNTVSRLTQPAFHAFSANLQSVSLLQQAAHHQSVHLQILQYGQLHQECCNRWREYDPVQARYQTPQKAGC